MTAGASYAVRGTDLVFASGARASFAHPVASVVEFDDVFVVMLDVPPNARHNENVYGVSRDGRVLWQIRPRPHVYADSPYTYVGRKGDSAALSNWDGLELTVDAETGAVLKEEHGR